jgi:hypothetical protein
MNLFLDEQLPMMHRQDLQHEVEQHRLARQAPNQGNILRFAIGKMGTLMVALGTRLQRLDPSVETYIYRSEYVE